MAAVASGKNLMIDRRDRPRNRWLRRDQGRAVVYCGELEAGCDGDCVCAPSKCREMFRKSPRAVVKANECQLEDAWVT